MRKKVFKQELRDFLSNGVVSEQLQMVVNNATMRIDDKRFSVDEAKEYIWEWGLKLQEQGYKFSEYEAKFMNQKIQPKYRLNIANSFAWSIINIFR